MRLRRSIPLALGATLLVGSLSGCNHAQDTGTEALDAPQSATAAPSPAGSPADASSGPSPTGTPFPATPAAPTSPAPAADSHVLDVPELAAALQHAISTYHSMHVSMRMTGGVTDLRAQGDVRYTADGPLMRLRMHMSSLGVRAVKLLMVHRMVYLAMPPMTPRGRWVAVDPTDPNSPLGPAAGAVAKIDPMQSFEVVEKGVRKVRYLGEDTLAGDPAFRYKLTVNTRAAARATGQPVNPMVPRMVSYDIWLDGQNRMRRMTLSELGVRMVFDVSRWGLPVHVQAPPPSRVLTMGSSGA